MSLKLRILDKVYESFEDTDTDPLSRREVARSLTEALEVAASKVRGELEAEIDVAVEQLERDLSTDPHHEIPEDYIFLTLDNAYYNERRRG